MITLLHSFFTSTYAFTVRQDLEISREATCITLDPFATTTIITITNNNVKISLENILGRKFTCQNHCEDDISPLGS